MNKNIKKNVILLFGGQSLEHEVSIESAKSVSNIIGNLKEYKLNLVYIDKNGSWSKVEKNFWNGNKKGKKVICDFEKGFFCNNKKIKTDIAFSIIHGNTGEDGKLQSLFELLNIPYVGCSVLSSAISMDKSLSKNIAKECDIPILEDILVDKEYFLKNYLNIKNKVKKMGYPVFVKPNTLGSSVGVFKIETEKEFKNKVLKSLKYDRQVLIEKAVDKAREIVCGVLGDYNNVQASLCGEVKIKGKHKFYDYNAKYLDDNGMQLLIPAPISKEISDQIREYTIKIFKAIKGYGLSRVDFFINPKNEKDIYFCEINTIPGFTSHSLYPSLWKETSIMPKDLVDKLLKLALKRNK